MKITTLLFAAAGAALLLPVAFGAGASHQEAEETKRGLVRVPPSQEGDVPSGTTVVDESNFDAGGWVVRLGADDLDAREASFDELVDLARRDPAARTFLEEMADITDDRELAWTARLALRELERTKNPFGELFGTFDDNTWPDLQGVFGNLQPLHVGPNRHWTFGPGHQALPRGAWNLSLPQGQGMQGHTSERSVSIEKDADGWVVEITEGEDGDKETRTYRGESLEAILEKNPELEGELGVGVGFGMGAPGGLRMRLDPNGNPLQVFEDLRFFNGARPMRGFTFRTEGDPKGRELNFFFSPQGVSEPTRTDVLGVRVGAPLSEERIAELGLEPGHGVYVSSVHPGTIAHILSVGSGDVLLFLNGRPLGDAEDITEALAGRDDTGAVKLEWVDALGQRHERVWTPSEEERTRQGAPLERTETDEE